ncbi:MAG: hypothetical protein ACR2M9_00290 [Cyanophyceae cyanobacterium]
MAVKFLDNLDLVGNQLQNVIIDVKNSAPASLGIGQLYMNVASSINTLVLDKGPKGGPHGILTNDLTQIVVPGSLQMTDSTSAGRDYTLKNSPATYIPLGFVIGNNPHLELNGNVTITKDTYFGGDIIDGGGNTGTSGQLLSSKGSGGGVNWIDAPVSYTKWILTGDTGTQDITDGNTVVVAGGSNITTEVTATDTVTVKLDNSITIKKIDSIDAGAQNSFAGQVTIPVTPVAGTDAASKSYVDNSVVGSLVFQGPYDAATNTPNLDNNPSPNVIKKGWSYVVTVDGLFFTEQVRVGDLIIAQKDGATTLSEWTTVQNNIDLASATQVGIGNVVPGSSAGIDVTYSNGTATLELSPVGLSRASGGPALTDTVTYDKAGTNHAATFSDIETLIGGGGGYVANSTGQTVHKFQHNLGTEYVMVEVLDFSETADRFNTVYATVTRPSANEVWVYTASAADILVLIKKVQ